jgi:hypothetical protein
MTPSTPMRLEWWRLALVLAIFGAIQAALILGAGVYRSYPSVTIGKLGDVFLGRSLTCRWVMLRAEVRNNRFSIERFRQDPSKYWRGPRGHSAFGSPSRSSYG